MRIMDEYLMEHPAADFTVFTSRLDMSTSPLFPLFHCVEKFTPENSLAFWEQYADGHSIGKC